MAIPRRIAPLTGTEARRQAVASQIAPDEFHTTNDQKRAFLENTYLGPVEHGTVANQAAMLALNATSPRGVWPGDQCLRSDAGVMFTCITNHGETAADWCPAVSTLPGNPSTGDVTIPHLPGASYITLDKFIDTMHSPGTVTGGQLTDAGGGNVNVAAGTAVLRIADDDVSQLVTLNFGPQVVAIPADNVVHYLALAYNAGTPTIITATSQSAFDNDTQVGLGSAVRLGASTLVFNNPFRVGDAMTNVIQRFDSLAPSNRDESVGGLALGETGTRNITLSAGRLWARLNDTPVAAKDTSAGSTLVSVYFNGATWVFTPGVTQWPNTQYNNVASGLSAMGVNRYSNLWFYLTVDTATVFMQYGQAEYNNFAQALAETRPTFTPPNAPYVALLVGRLIFRNGDATAQLIQSAFTTDFAGTVVTNHNDLANIQGGTIGEYFHLTNAAYANISAGPLATPTFARLDIINPGSSGIINIDSDATAASLLRFYRAATVKWSLRNSSTDIFDIFNDGLLQSAISIIPATNEVTVPVSLSTGSLGVGSAANAFIKAIVVGPSTSANIMHVVATGAPFAASVLKIGTVDPAPSGNLFLMAVGTNTDGTGGSAFPFRVTATGINATAIGATTPSTGAFTQITSTGLVSLIYANPRYEWYDTGAGTDAKRWDIIASGGIMSHRLINDANSAANTWLQVSRTGYTAATVAFPGGINNTPIGATTPAAGTFTTINGTGILSVAKAAGEGRIKFQNEGADVYNVMGSRNSADSAYLPLVIRASTMTVDGGINGTAIGATTPSTGAFTQITSTGLVALNYASPRYEWYDTGAGTDAKRWDIIASGGIMSHRLINDANSAANTWLQVSRTGYTAATVAFPGGINNTPIGATTPSTGVFTTAVVGATTSPAVNFEVSGGDQSISRVRIRNTAAVEAYDLVAGVNAVAQSGFSIYDVVNNATRFTLVASGNVGIGTNSPGAKLEVNGDIKTSSPSGGTAQPWKLGNVVAGAVTLDAANYVAVEINGVAVKLLKAA